MSATDPTADAFFRLTALAHAYRNGALRPSQVVRAHLDRIEKLDPRIGAFQSVYAETAMAQAEASDRAMQTGRTQGPFHGIPFGLKDICDLEGHVTTGGSKAMEHRVSTRTAPVAQRLLDAGGILLGKTKTVECAFGGWGTNQHMGTPRNPWDVKTHRVPGGSSSGTAASVASGMAVCGVGTDTGGSVRIPAGYCGLVGLKVTQGRLPTEGIIPLSRSLDTPGPLARSIEDALVMYQVMEGRDGAEIAQQQRDGRGVFGLLTLGVEGLRLGVLPDTERALCSDEVLHSYQTALATLAKLGAELKPFTPPASFAELTENCGNLIATEAYAEHKALYDQPDLPMDEDVRSRMLQGRGVRAHEYIRLCQTRARETRAFLDLLSGFDAILTPTATTAAPRIEDVDQNTSPAHFTRMANYFGLSALSLPSGLSADGLPIGLQVIARPNDEAMALRIGAAFERVTDPLMYPVQS